MKRTLTLLAAGVILAGCDPECACKLAPRAESLAQDVWKSSEWISVKDAPVIDAKVAPHGSARAADGNSWFVGKFTNAGEIKSAKWMVTGLGVFEVYVNGVRVGADALKPGFTHTTKTRVSFTYDVTKLLKTEAGAENALAAQVGAGWWRDKIVHFAGKKSAFRGVLEVTYADGTKKLFGSNTADWKCGVAGPVTHAAIFDGEEYDARVQEPLFGEGLVSVPERNEEFAGEIVPSAGAEICLRCDKALSPVEAYAWKGVTGADEKKLLFGTVVKTETFDPEDALVVRPGETVVVDFGQNCAAVPFFRFSAKAGTVLTVLPGEMLNDGNGAKGRGNDGPEGSLYRKNLRIPEMGMRAVYTFRGEGTETYLPRFTFFGYRYVSLTATGEVEIETLKSVPVTSITKCMESGRIETGVKEVNRLIANVYWGQLSNYLSVPTDCPQRNERLGWTADTQVFCEAGTFNADTSRFFRKWMRDMRDSQHEKGGFPGVAPMAQYGNNPMRLGWADAGIIVPYQIWKQFGDVEIVRENWAAMEKYLDRVNETKYETKALVGECGNYQWADWLSYEKLESNGGGAFEKTADGKRKGPKADAVLYWDFLGACYWMWDAQMMTAMARATGKDASKYVRMAADAKRHLKSRFFGTPDGLVLPVFRDMQTPALFALKLGLVEGVAKTATINALKRNFAEHGDCLQTGFLGTSILMDTLTENGMADIAYTLLLQHKNPSWLYSVDQGATTIWERWNSYRKDVGFGPVGMNSFNHYAYGSVLAWIYKTAAGIAADPEKPGFANVVMKPVPDKRLGHVTAEYRTPHGVVKSAWRYEGDKWIWDFTVPEGATASVTYPGELIVRKCAAGTYHVEK